jgi:hypothetical protein
LSEEKGPLEAPEPPRVTFGRSFVHKLSVFLTTPETVELGRELAVRLKAFHDETLAAKLEAKKRRGELELMGIELEELRTAVETGTRERLVECHEEHNFTKGVINLVRDDRGEIFDTRSMTDQQRQKEMFKEAPVFEPAEPEAGAETLTDQERADLGTGPHGPGDEG